MNTGATIPLPWMLIVQWIVIISFTSLNIAALILLVQRKRKIQIHVMAHSQNQSWEEVRNQIEERIPDKVEWTYSPEAKERLGL